MTRHRLLPLFAAAFGMGIAARPAAAQQQEWAPAPVSVAQPPPAEGGGVGLQILAGAGIGAAAVVAMALANQYSRSDYATWGLIAVTPAAVGLAACSLGRPSDRREPSCPRAVTMAYVGSLIALPVLAIGVLESLHWGTGPNPHAERDEAIVVGTTSVAWVGGMTLGAIVFGRRRIRPPAYAPPAPAPWPVGVAPADDPREARWVGARSSGQLVFRLASIDF